MKVVRTSDIPKKPHQTPLFTSPDVYVSRAGSKTTQVEE
jgi:hypothetical protein